MTQDAKRWPIVEVVDPSPKRGLFAIWAAFTPQDFVKVVRARHIEAGSFDTMSQAIKNERTALPRWPVIAIMDQRGGQFVANHDQQRTWFDEFHDRGLYYMPSTDPPMEMLHDWLRIIHRPELGLDLPKLMIVEDAAVEHKDNPLWALERFVWDPIRTGRQWQYNQAGKDWVDCLRYLAGFPGLTYHRLIGKQDQRPAGDLAESYSESPNERGADLESQLLQRGLIPDNMPSLSESYDSIPIRPRGSPF